MTVESASFISGLVPAYPPGSDSISEGDDHLRLIKSVLQGTFPNANAAMNGIHTGASAPTSTSAGQLWFDTTLNVLKIRNEADSGWITLGASPVTDFKILGSNTVGWIPPTADGSPNQFLTTDGSGNLDWASASGDELPSQTGHSGKYLTTNGTSASWATTSDTGTLLGVTHKIDSSSNRPADDDTYENSGMTVSHTKDSATSNLYVQFDCYLNTACNYDGASTCVITGYLGGSSGDPATIITDTTADLPMIHFEDVGVGTGITWDASNTFSRTFKVTAANCPGGSGSTGTQTFNWPYKMNDRSTTTVTNRATWMVWEIEE